MRRLVHATAVPRSRAPSSSSVISRSRFSTTRATQSQRPREAVASDSQEYCFETGYGLFAKRPSRPFPPPFLSPPSHSFSDALSTYHRSRNGQPAVYGERLKGLTNGDDAILAGEHYVGVNDGVGAWSTRPKGHAAYASYHTLPESPNTNFLSVRCSLWSRLILHFWALETERELFQAGVEREPNPIEYLQRAYDRTITATSSPNEWQGTTTACTAIVRTSKTDGGPVLYATNLGDSQILVLRPHAGEVIYKTVEQWHWFDCPRQLGTNSPDTPRKDAVMDRIPIQEHDVVLAMSDGVTDNLWEHEVVRSVLEALREWETHRDRKSSIDDQESSVGAMDYVAQALVKAARIVAEDPFAESPFMERAVEEGLAMEGG